MLKNKYLLVSLLSTIYFSNKCEPHKPLVTVELQRKLYMISLTYIELVQTVLYGMELHLYGMGLPIWVGAEPVWDGIHLYGSELNPYGMGLHL